MDPMGHSKNSIMFQEPMGNDVTAMISLGIPLEKKTKKQSKHLPSNNGITLNSLTFLKDFTIPFFRFAKPHQKPSWRITHDFIHVQTGHIFPQKTRLPKNQVAMAFRTFHAFNHRHDVDRVASGYWRFFDIFRRVLIDNRVVKG